MPETSATTSVNAQSRTAQPGGMSAQSAPVELANAGDLESRARPQKRIYSENFLGPMISLGLHALFLLLAALFVIRPPLRSGALGPGPEAELAGLSAESISDLPNLGFQATDPAIQAAMDLQDLSAQMLDADMVITEISLSDAGPVDSLGGAGTDVDASGGGLGGGGGGGTSFFGVASRGRFFMYIVDTSGSMGSANRIKILVDNLKSSIRALPEHASFFIFAYNERALPMSGATQWRLANRENKLRAERWITNGINAGGGTDPTDAIERAFKFQPAPDVIYFMTDAQDLAGIPEFVTKLNVAIRKTKIHCIAFGDSGSESAMRRISKQSGGKYRYVPDGGN